MGEIECEALEHFHADTQKKARFWRAFFGFVS
jgi:hypothetical protein